jgi:hypothetical protein
MIQSLSDDRIERDASAVEPAEAQARRAQIRAEARARVALEDLSRARDALFEALHPAPRHGRAALECLEIDDDVGLTHHIEGFFASAKAAWTAWGALKRLQGPGGEKADAA